MRQLKNKELIELLQKQDPDDFPCAWVYIKDKQGTGTEQLTFNGQVEKEGMHECFLLGVSPALVVDENGYIVRVEQ